MGKISGCAAVCLGVSVAGVVLLVSWGLLLVFHSLGSFPDLPDDMWTKAGYGCFITACLYFVTGVLSLIVYLRFRNDKVVAREISMRRRYTKMSDGYDDGPETASL
eukprot:Selendium_serpulae@DN7358_c0_g1_i1.p1